MSLEGTDGLKTGSSDIADYNHTITTKRDGFRINQVIMGAGDYKNLGGEKQRNMIGNGLMNMSFDQYKYTKILSKGEQKINGKTYFVEKIFTMYYQKTSIKTTTKSLLKMTKHISTMTVNLFQINMVHHQLMLINHLYIKQQQL